MNSACCGAELALEHHHHSGGRAFKIYRCPECGEQGGMAHGAGLPDSFWGAARRPELRADGGEMVETCDHHGDQVALRVFDVDPERVAFECVWCDEAATTCISQDELFYITFCDDCVELLKILLREADDE